MKEVGAYRLTTKSEGDKAISRSSLSALIILLLCAMSHVRSWIIPFYDQKSR